MFKELVIILMPKAFLSGKRVTDKSNVDHMPTDERDTVAGAAQAMEEIKKKVEGGRGERMKKVRRIYARKYVFYWRIDMF